MKLYRHVQFELIIICLQRKKKRFIIFSVQTTDNFGRVFIQCCSNKNWMVSQSDECERGRKNNSNNKRRMKKKRKRFTETSNDIITRKNEMEISSNTKLNYHLSRVDSIEKRNRRKRKSRKKERKKKKKKNEGGETSMAG